MSERQDLRQSSWESQGSYQTFDYHSTGSVHGSEVLEELLMRSRHIDLPDPQEGGNNLSTLAVVIFVCRYQSMGRDFVRWQTVLCTNKLFVCSVLLSGSPPS